MGIWKGIASIFSNSDVVEHVSNGIDKSIYTDEEKAEAYSTLLKLYEPFKMTQRVLSVGMFVILFLTLFISATLRVVGNMVCEPTIIEGQIIRWWVEDSTWIMNQSIGMFGEPFLYASVLYFGGGAFEGVANRMAGRRDAIRKGKLVQSTK